LPLWVLVELERPRKAVMSKATFHFFDVFGKFALAMVLLQIIPIAMAFNLVTIPIPLSGFVIFVLR
jgi:hypothetical protein